MWTGLAAGVLCFDMMEPCSAGKAENEARALQKSVVDLTAQKQASRKELDVLTELNRGLISNQQTYKDMVTALQSDVQKKDAIIAVCPSRLTLSAPGCFVA